MRLYSTLIFNSTAHSNDNFAVKPLGQKVDCHLLILKSLIIQTQTQLTFYSTLYTELKLTLKSIEINTKELILHLEIIVYTNF